MNNAFIWMWNTRGGAKRVDMSNVPKMEGLGWFVVPHKQIGDNGDPKSMYDPRYDTNYNKPSDITEDIPVKKEYLDVEII